MSAVVNPIISVVTAVLPTLPALVVDIVALFKKYSEMTQTQIASAVVAVSTQSDTAFTDAIDTVNAAAQSPTPVVHTQVTP